ncbi:MAG: TonB-dependent receptor [Cyclobacteriaceae bacterium]|nr:TonB-dependent receptor [Cyclobacteriaceae bacterium HetDA_MAG_MS6]
MFKKFFLLLVNFSFSAFVFAQTGNIRATVYDDEFGETLIGATVLIQGTSTGSVTDLDGKALITGIAPGTYTVEVSYVSFEKQVITGIEVVEGNTTTLDIRLKTETLGLEEVVVTAEVIRNNESALLTVQKKSAKVLDAISSDMFSINGDNDAAAAVKRVVGVTIEGGKYVYVRGLGDRYSKATLNGADVPSLDPNRNSVQMDLFPSNLIDNIVVYKTFTPDLPGDFSGGLVNISTKDFPDELTMQASASVGFNSQATLNSDFLTHEGSSTDFIGFGIGEREIPSYVRNYVSSVGDRRFPIVGPDPNEDVERFAQAFEQRQFAPTTQTQPFNHSLNFSLGNQKTFLGKQFGFVGGLTYNRNFSFYDDGRVGRWNPISSSTTNLVEDQSYDVIDSRSTDEVNWGAVLNSSIKLDRNHKIGLNLMHNQSGIKESRFQDGPWDAKGNLNDFSQFSISNTRNRVLAWTQRGVSNAQLKGEHLISGMGNLKVEWFSSYTFSTFDQPDLRFLQDSYFEEVDNPGVIAYEITNKNRPARFFRDMQETNLDNKIHLELPVKVLAGLEGKLKFGGAYTAKDREYREDIYDYKLENVNPYTGDVSQLFTDEAIALNNEGLLVGTTVEQQAVQTNNYDAEQKISAGYLMMETAITEKLRTSFGARIENTQQTVQSFDPNGRGEINATDVLPAINFTFELIENTNLRASYSKTLARPSFREFAPFTSFGFYGDNVQNGNDSLKRTIINNFDLRLETYPSPGEYLGISLFYKHLNNPIENTFVSFTAENDLQLIYSNVPEAILYGVELEVRKSLDFISSSLKDFRISTNFSYIISEVDIARGELEVRRNFDPGTESTRPMFNQSPFVVNASLQYNNVSNGISSSLSFNVFGERLKLISRDLLDVFEQPRPELNFTIKKQLGDRLSTRFRANNLLNPDIKEIINFRNEDFVYSSYTRGTSFSIGVTYALN